MSSFPMDVQRCTMTFESYSFNVGRVRLDWFETAVILDLQVYLDHFNHCMLDFTSPTHQEIFFLILIY